VELLALPGDLGGGVQAGGGEESEKEAFHGWLKTNANRKRRWQTSFMSHRPTCGLVCPMPPIFILNEDPIQPAASVFETDEGAEVQFLGVVRGSEDGKAISGIDYSVYLPMAEKMLRELVERGEREHGPHRVFIQHRLGFVAAEQPSIIIKVRTKHSAEAFDLCRWYLKEIKTCVPIWKRAVFVDQG